jgi:endonuclease III
MSDDRELVRALLDRYGQTYAQEAGIELADRPVPLYQLLVLTTLLSTRIRASVAIAAARELFAAGCRSPQQMVAANRRTLLAALGRGHYKRYDERTSTMLADGARLCLNRWHGDLRRLHREADGDPPALRRLLTEFPGIGPTGAEIFLREVQAVWPELRPYTDRRVSTGAQRLGLPASAEKLAGLTGPADFARLASALVRVSLGEQPIDDRELSGDLARAVAAR